MPTRQEFLGAVLPPEGLYCVVGIKDKTIHSQTFHRTLGEVDAAVDGLEEAGVNSFVALANFQNDRNRTAPNALRLKSLFLDLDVGADDPKKYPDQQTAVAALRKFVKDLKLPRPMVVDSGNGVHAYWPLTEEVDRAEWKVVADRFKLVCALNGLLTDPAVTADAARVLRAVGSSNFKDADNPRPVTVLNAVPLVDLSVMKDRLGVGDTALATAPKQPLNALTKSLLANKPSSFRLILKKSLAGNGCQQLVDAVSNQETMSEPMWRAALSIAQFCKDRDVAIHRISAGHPDYTPEETEAKAQRIQGPYLCTTFEGDNPSGCAGCKHKGKISTPLVLGQGEVEVATAEDNIVTDTKQPEKVYTIPEYPFPFVRGKNGGIYVREKDEDDNPKDKLVYENDYYLVNTVDDPLQGMSALFRLHLPQDGVKEFLIPMKEMTAKDVFSKRVAEQGLSTIGKQMESLIAFSNMSIKKYQRESRADKARLQFGWADRNSSFIIGDRQVTATDVVYSPPSSVTLGLVKLFGQSGTLEDWKRIVAFYNRPGMELHMFTLFAGFGSPLVPFSKHKGGVISLYSEGSGVGKTTTLKMINSIFGNPDELLMIKADTMNARMQRIGTLQNITPTIDEITNESPEVTSEFLYHYLHARGRNRLHGSVNIERLNASSWNAHCVVTANSALEDKLFTKKRNPDGELARFLEFPYTPGNTDDKTVSDDVFTKLKSNYGLAGVPFIQHTIRELPQIVDAMNQMQHSLDLTAKLTQRERYWSNIATTTLTGGLTAREAGVIDFSDSDFERIHNWTGEMLVNKRKASVNSAPDSSLMLGAFLSENINNVLIINSGTRRNSAGIREAAIREPRGPLVVRYEPDTKELFVNRPKFRKFCTESQVAYESVLASLNKKGQFLGERKVRMGKGLQFSDPEMALVFIGVGEGLLDEHTTNARNPDQD